MCTQPKLLDFRRKPILISQTRKKSKLRTRERNAMWGFHCKLHRLMHFVIFYNCALVQYAYMCWYMYNYTTKCMYIAIVFRNCQTKYTQKTQKALLQLEYLQWNVICPCMEEDWSAKMWPMHSKHRLDYSARKADPLHCNLCTGPAGIVQAGEWG